MKGKLLFVCKRDYAIFVDIETVIPEKDFDEDPAKDVTSQDRGEMMPKSMGYDPSRYSGKICYMHFSIKTNDTCALFLLESLLFRSPHNSSGNSSLQSVTKFLGHCTQIG